MSLEIIMGPMFSGKTTELCRRVRRLQHTNRTALIINHDSDDRYGASDQTLTHDNISCSSVPVNNLMSLNDTEAYAVASDIFINEAQFFPDLSEFVIRAVENDNKNVIIFGLDGDYERKQFGSILELIPLADSLTKLTALCKLCGDGTPALFTKRTDTNKSGQVLIGGSDIYMAVCRKHYLHS